MVLAQTLQQRMLAAEDARVATPAGIAPLLEGLRSADAARVAQAARGLGRFERAEYAPLLLPLLTSVRPEVRREAANAIGQALASARREDPERPELASARRTLLNRLRGGEADAAARGILAETLGRLPHRDAAAVSDVEAALVALIATPATQPPAVLRGVMRGLDDLARGNQKVRTAAPQTNARIRAVAMLPADPADVEMAAVRRTAWLAALAAGAADGPLVEQGLDDPDVQVRRLAVAAIGTMAVAGAARGPLLARALADPSFNVRHEAVRVYGRTRQSQDCAPLLRAIDDPDMHVSLAAIDALGAGCPAGPDPSDRLARLADTLETGPGAAPQSAAAAWHKPAHAFEALARVAREPAVARLPRFAEHPVWQVRTYAARAATALFAGARLQRLAADPADNVREAAIAGLRTVLRHDADPSYIAALARPDYQLVMTAAQALEGAPNGEAVMPALLAAFGRITAERRDTSRDPRLALLARIRELGSAAHAPALQPCLRDFDPVVSGECADILRSWGRPAAVQAPPRPAAAALMNPLPTRARITMARGGAMEWRLLPEDAPYTVSRFATLARRGYYNGLTIHRVVPNFVLQGGSPGANEYAGDGPFMRDELGLRSNARGTIGTSTRGRDTGDAQFFVNLVDNPRLDRDFTVFAEITDGLDVMDRVIEGDVISRVDVF